MSKEREAFSAWVVTHPDNLDITDYEERIMFDAWRAAKDQAMPEGCVLVPKEPTYEMLLKIESPLGFNFEVPCGHENAGIDTETASEIYKAMIEAHVPNQPPKFNLDEFLSMEQKLKSKGGVITADLDRFIAYAEMALEKAKALKEPK